MKPADSSDSSRTLLILCLRERRNEGGRGPAALWWFARRGPRSSAKDRWCSTSCRHRFKPKRWTADLERPQAPPTADLTSIARMTMADRLPQSLERVSARRARCTPRWTGDGALWRHLPPPASTMMRQRDWPENLRAQRTGWSAVSNERDGALSAKMHSRVRECVVEPERVTCQKDLRELEGSAVCKRGFSNSSVHRAHAYPKKSEWWSRVKAKRGEQVELKGKRVERGEIEGRDWSKRDCEISVDERDRLKA